MTPHSCGEMTGSRTVATNRAVPSPKLGTSRTKARAKFRAKVEAGRSRSKMAQKVRVSRARVAPVARNKIRVANSLGSATFVERQATGQPTARRKAECKKCLHMMTKCFRSREWQEFRCVQVARRLFPCRETASPVTSERTDKGMPHTAPAFARQAECFFSALS